MRSPRLVRRAYGAALTLVVSALAGQACMPAVMHSPRIEPGPAIGLTASYTAGPEYDNGDDGPSRFAYGPVGVNLGYGWTSSRIDGLGAGVGVHVPVPLIPTGTALELRRKWTQW